MKIAFDSETAKWSTATSSPQLCGSKNSEALVPFTQTHTCCYIGLAMVVEGIARPSPVSAGMFGGVPLVTGIGR